MGDVSGGFIHIWFFFFVGSKLFGHLSLFIFIYLFVEQTKTLMFFEGCPQHLGCTIKLRGGSDYELARVKEILIFMICVAYHSQLEISFLMDEFAMPPTLMQSPSFHLLTEGRGEEGASQEQVSGSSLPQDPECPREALSSEDSTLLESRTVLEKGELDNKSIPQAVASLKHQDYTTPTCPAGIPCALFALVPESLLPLHMDQQDAVGNEQPETSQQTDEQQDPKSQMKAFRDPLQDDTGMYVTEEVTSSEDQRKTYALTFKQELKDVILCISPVITFREPFLLTEKGMRCSTRDYFPEQIYWSPLLNKEVKEMESRRKKQLLRDLSGLQGMNGSVQAKSIQVLPSHELVSTRIAEHLGDSQTLGRMLADYRARGGRIQSKHLDPFVHSKDASCTSGGKSGNKTESDEERGLIPSDVIWPTKVGRLGKIRMFCLLKNY